VSRKLKGNHLNQDPKDLHSLAKKGKRRSSGPKEQYSQRPESKREDSMLETME
jgi:hypothetical protein